MPITIYTDGASRGNPGQAGLGVVITLPDGTTKHYAKYIGKATNNQAEYQAIILAFEKAASLVGKKNLKTTSLEFFMDSELACKQLNGEYKLKNEDVQKAFIDIWNKKIDFQQVSFQHVRRELNKEADKMANKAIDEFNSHKSLL